MKKIIGFLIVNMMITAGAYAQSSAVRWQRKSPPVKPELRLFHSTLAIDLPTGETLQQGLFYFEIAHRFFPPISEGPDFLYGLDGPVNMRLGLGYAPTDLLMITFARSNVLDNIDLQAKYKLARFRHQIFPLILAVQGGVAWNTEKLLGRSKSDSRNFQYYGQLIINTMWQERLALGAVPSYLYNNDIFSQDAEDMFLIGLYTQLYVNNVLSLLAEWTPAVSGQGRNHDPVAFGLELETGGHFFKIIATNSIRLNPAQYLAGSEYPFDTDEWRLGFLITRLLSL